MLQRLDPHPRRSRALRSALRRALTLGLALSVGLSHLHVNDHGHLTATDLQDHLLVATNDLDRLQRLLGDASEALVAHFYGAAGQMKLLLRQAAAHPELDATSLNLAMNHLAGAITSLQFQDMASQLITHTGRRLRACADRLAAEAMEMDDANAAFVDTVPLTPNPVTQDEMDAGSVELF